MVVILLSAAGHCLWEMSWNRPMRLLPPGFLDPRVKELPT